MQEKSCLNRFSAYLSICVHIYISANFLQRADIKQTWLCFKHGGHCRPYQAHPAPPWSQDSIALSHLQRDQGRPAVLCEVFQDHFCLPRVSLSSCEGAYISGVGEPQLWMGKGWSGILQQKDLGGLGPSTLLCEVPSIAFVTHGPPGFAPTLLVTKLGGLLILPSPHYLIITVTK